jgi:hypothetical protein
MQALDRSLNFFSAEFPHEIDSVLPCGSLVRYLFHGDADLNLTRNVSRALELFDAAASTTTEAAWNSMLLLGTRKARR